MIQLQCWTYRNYKYIQIIFIINEKLINYTTKYDHNIA